MANPPFSFVNYLKKMQPKSEAFTGRVPRNNWTLGLHCTCTWHSSLKNSGTFQIGNEESHDILCKMYLLVSLNITCNIVYMWKSNLLEYLLAKFVQEHRNIRLTGI